MIYAVLPSWMEGGMRDKGPPIADFILSVNQRVAF